MTLEGGGGPIGLSVSKCVELTGSTRGKDDPQWMSARLAVLQ